MAVDYVLFFSCPHIMPNRTKIHEAHRKVLQVVVQNALHMSSLHMGTISRTDLKLHSGCRRRSHAINSLIRYLLRLKRKIDVYRELVRSRSFRWWPSSRNTNCFYIATTSWVVVVKRNNRKCFSLESKYRSYRWRFLWYDASKITSTIFLVCRCCCRLIISFSMHLPVVNESRVGSLR